MNNGASAIKRILEIAVAIVIALFVFQIISSILWFAMRVIISVAVFAGVVFLLDSLLFGRKRITR